MKLCRLTATAVLIFGKHFSPSANIRQKKFEVSLANADEFSKTNEVITIDGARILFENGWGLVRASNTQTILVLRFEADSADNLQKIRETVESRVKDFIG